MVIEMKKGKKLRDLILPNKKINCFVFMIMVFGVLSGSIFLMMLNDGDRVNVISQIQSFFQNISKGSVDYGLAFRNSLIINYIFVLVIWILGFSLIGILFNIFLTYIKGFLVGFSISAIFLTYGYKGLPACLVFCFPCQILNMFAVLVLTIYSVMFSFQLLSIIVSKRKNQSLMLKKYFVIFMMMVIVSFGSSLFESYLFPRILKMMIGIYV